MVWLLPHWMLEMMEHEYWARGIGGDFLAWYLGVQLLGRNRLIARSDELQVCERGANFRFRTVATLRAEHVVAVDREPVSERPRIRTHNQAIVLDVGLWTRTWTVDVLLRWVASAAYVREGTSGTSRSGRPTSAETSTEVTR